ncbi:maltose permease [Sarocladium strictum]
MVIFLLPINYGYEASLIGKVFAVPSFMVRFGETTETGARQISAQNQQIIAAGFFGGIFIAAFITGMLSDFWGRRKTIMLGCVICVAGVFVQAFAETILQIFGGKLIGTVGFGIGHVLAPVYVAEIAPDELRGTCLTLINTMIVAGGWACALVGLGGSYIQSDWGWRMPILTQLVPPTIMFVLVIFLLPESPSWLLLRDRREDALASMRKFRGDDAEAEAAIAKLQATIDKEHEIAQSKPSYADCFKGTNRRRTVIVCMTYMAQQFVGSNFVSSYLPYFFTVAGVTKPIAVAQGAFSIQLVGNLISVFLIDRVGRRPMVAYGTMALAALLLMIGGISMLTSQAGKNAMVALMCLWGLLFQLLLGAPAYAVGGETPTPRLRQKTYSINQMIGTAIGTMYTMVTPLLINPGNANLGGKVAFIFFAPSLPTAIYHYFCFPEMKGRNYLELEEMFQRKVPARQFRNYNLNVEVLETNDGEKVAVVEKETKDVED